MKKLITICIFIIITVILSDFLIKKKINNHFDYMSSSLKQIDEEPDNDKRKKIIKEVDSYINDNFLLMAFYIDHGELEKIKTQIIIIKAGIEKDDDTFLHEEIERTIFIIDHLKRKIDFKLENIL